MNESQYIKATNELKNFISALTPEQKSVFIHKVSQSLGVTPAAVYQWISGKNKIRRLFRMHINKIAKQKIFSE